MPGNGITRRRQREQLLCELLREGVPVDRAAPAVGLVTHTVFWWASQARQGNPAYRRFLVAYETAMVERRRNVELLLDAARGRLNGH